MTSCREACESIMRTVGPTAALCASWEAPSAGGQGRRVVGANERARLSLDTLAPRLATAAMTALAELNRPPPFRRPSPPGSKRSAFASAPPPPADDDDDDWAALEAAAEADAAERAALMLDDEGEDVDMDVLREIEAQERDASSRRDGDTRGAGTISLGKGAAGAQKTASTTSAAPTGDRKGKSRMLLEEDDEFGAVGEDGRAAESLLSRGASLSPILEPLRDDS